MKDGLYLVGGGGHCKACIDVIEEEGIYSILGVVDLPAKLDEQVLGYRFVGTDNDLERLVKSDVGFLVTIGQVGSAAARVKAFNFLKKLGALIPQVLSPCAHVSSHALIAEGTIVMHGVTVNASAKVGSNCILNSHCLIEHDAQIADHCHISTGAIVNGACKVGSRSFVGSNSVLAHGVEIAADVVVGAGSVVPRDIIDAGVYVGNPCRRIR